MRLVTTKTTGQLNWRSVMAGFGPQILASASYMLALLIPFSNFWPLTAPLIASVFVPYVTPGLFLPDIAVALAIISVIANRRRLDPGPLELIGALAGLCLLAVLTAPWALSTPLALYTAARWLIAFAVYLCFAQRLVPIERIVWFFAAGLCLHTVVGLLQVSANGPLGLPGEIAIPNSSDLAWTFRASGFSFHPNVLGGYLVVGLLLIIPQLNRRLILAGWWLMWLGLLATFSRSAWLAIALTAPLVILWQIRRKPEMRRPMLVALLGLFAVLVVASFVWREQMTVRLQPILGQAQQVLETITPAPEGPPTTDPAGGDTKLDRALASSDYSLSERFVQFEIAFLVIKESPLQGIGAGNFPIFMRQLTLAIPPNFVHNVPLLLAAEIGILGAGLWLALCLMFAGWLIRRWRATDGWAIAAVCAGLALAIIALFDFYPWGLNTGRLLTVMVLGFIARTASIKKDSTK